MILICMGKKCGHIYREEHRDCRGIGSGQMQVWGMEHYVQHKVSRRSCREYRSYIEYEEVRKKFID